MDLQAVVKVPGAESDAVVSSCLPVAGSSQSALELMKCLPMSGHPRLFIFRIPVAVALRQPSYGSFLSIWLTSPARDTRLPLILSPAWHARRF